MAGTVHALVGSAELVGGVGPAGIVADVAPLVTVPKLSTIAEQTLIGLSAGVLLFLIASGLTVILGILDVLNLAHGELYAFGAFASFGLFGYVIGTQTSTGTVMQPPGGNAAWLAMLVFLGLIVLTALAVAAVFLPIGMTIEATLLEPIYERSEVYQLVLTFALLLILADLREVIFGSGSQTLFSIQNTVNDVPTTELLGLNMPTVELFVMVVGLVLAGLLFWFFDRTKTGRIIRATAINREMSIALGVNPDRIFTLVFAFGGLLAGFAGSMEFVSNQAQTAMGETELILSFVVIVVGGLGNLKGAFVGALLVGLLSEWMVWANLQYGLGFNGAEIAAPFVIMIVVLLVKPEGLYGTWGEIE